jgi:hypothetical protein
MTEREMGLVLFVARAKTPKDADRMGAGGWTKCHRCHHGVAIMANEMAKVAAGTVDPVCMDCGEELFREGAMDEATKVGKIGPFGQIVPDKETP